jgi:hypothetical protein
MDILPFGDDKPIFFDGVELAGTSNRHLVICWDFARNCWRPPFLS